MSELLFKSESYKIIGICMQIHRALGMGLKEVNYKDAMEMDFIEQQIIFEREKKFEVFYKGIKLRHPYFADFVIDNCIVLEIKSSVGIIDAHMAQARTYLSVAGIRLAMVINFGEKSLIYKRVVL